MKDKLIEHYDYLYRLAAAKCRDRADAEDMVSETILAALAFLHRGGVIEYPRTWLANTLMHKCADLARRRCGAPTVISLELCDPDGGEDFLEEYLASEEAAAVRRELNYLASITREVLMRHYVRGERIAVIAEVLGIPEGTVKSRLDAGRKQVRKGLETMEETKNYLPGRLHIWNSGASGPKGEPQSLVEGDLIVQNVLMIAYDKPLTAAEIARRIGIPTVYIEPIAEKLVDGELMAKTDGGKYYTDFLMMQAQTEPDEYHAELAFVEAHYPVLREETVKLIHDVRALNLPLRERQYMKLERFTVLKALQNFQLNTVPEVLESAKNHPKRRDGGTWTAAGIAYPADFAEPAWQKEAFNNRICGGHRFSGADEPDVMLRLFEFDTPFWDSPARFGVCGYEVYFEQIHRFLWKLHGGGEVKSGEFSEALLTSVDRYCELGVLTRGDGVLMPDIPVLEHAVFREVDARITAAYDALRERIGEAYRAWVLSRKKIVPPHLTSPLWQTYTTNACIPMVTVRRLHAEGLHMQGVDYCCPPMVLTFEKK